MISEYLEKEVVIAQLKSEIANKNYDFDRMIETGREIGDYIAYFYANDFEPMWILTNKMIGIVEGVVISENLEQGFKAGLIAW